MQEMPRTNQLLYSSIVQRNWMKARKILEEQQTDQVVLEQKILFKACIKNAPLDLVQSILNVCPGLIIPRERRNYGEAPLHYACVHSEDDVVDLLLHLAPQVTSCIDPKSGWLPLHLAVETCHLWGLKRIQMLLKVNPSTAFSCGQDGRRAIQVLFLFKFTDNLEEIRKKHGNDFSNVPRHKSYFNKMKNVLDTFVFLLEREARIANHPCDIYQPSKEMSKQGFFPLHEALKLKIKGYANTKSNVPLIYIRLLIKFYPEELLKIDCDGNTPLNLAMQSESRGKDEIVEVVLRGEPDAVRIPSGSTVLYPFMEALCDTSTLPFTMGYEMLRMNPDFFSPYK